MNTVTPVEDASMYESLIAALTVSDDRLVSDEKKSIKLMRKST